MYSMSVYSTMAQRCMAEFMVSNPRSGFRLPPHAELGLITDRQPFSPTFLELSPYMAEEKNNCVNLGLQKKTCSSFFRKVLSSE